MCVLPHVVTLLQLKPIIIENSYFFAPFCDESSFFANQVEEKFETHFWKWGPRIMILALLCRLFCNNKDEKMRISFLRVGPKIWNSLPSEMRNLPKSTFRKKTRNKLFEILSKSDDYLEITEIMHQLKFN